MSTGAAMPVLSDDKLTCTVIPGEIVLKTGQSIDFKSSIERKISMGKITDFKYAGRFEENKASIWMRLEELGTKSTVSEWISVNVWFDHWKKNLFGNNKKKPNDKSGEPTTPVNTPF